MVKIAVLVSGGGTNLQALIDRQQAGELGCGQIGLVLSSRPGVYALERAQKAGIETVVVDRKSCATAEEFSARVLHQLHAIRARPELLKVLLFKENPKKRED